MEELVNLKTAPAHDLGVTGAHSDLQFLLFVCNVGVLHNCSFPSTLDLFTIVTAKLILNMSNWVDHPPIL